LPVFNLDNVPEIAAWLMEQGPRFDYDHSQYA
jgi:hypothetical protein